MLIHSWNWVLTWRYNIKLIIIIIIIIEIIITNNTNNIKLLYLRGSYKMFTLSDVVERRGESYVIRLKTKEIYLRELGENRWFQVCRTNCFISCFLMMKQTWLIISRLSVIVSSSLNLSILTANLWTWRGVVIKCWSFETGSCHTFFLCFT